MNSLHIIVELAGFAAMLATTSGVLAVIVMRWAP